MPSSFLEDFMHISSENSDTKTVEDNPKDVSAGKQDQEFIFIHDTGFNVQIAAPGLEPFEIQVSVSFRCAY